MLVHITNLKLNDQQLKILLVVNLKQKIFLGYSTAVISNLIETIYLKLYYIMPFPILD